MLFLIQRMAQMSHFKVQKKDGLKKNDRKLLKYIND